MIDIRSPYGLRACLKMGDVSWPGMYPLYYVTADGGVLSPAAVRANQRLVEEAIDSGADAQWQVIGCDINYENPHLYCDDTNKRIPSAYGVD